MEISKKQQSLLTADEARRLLSYDKNTGELRRLVRTSSRMKVGDVAGDKFHNGQRSYWRVRVKNSRFVAHRVIWLIVTGEWPENEIDHINGDGTDNRWDNLRSVTHSENCRNRRMRSDNKSGQTGVFWCRKSLRWTVQIKVDGKQKKLGSFKDKDAAITARKQAEREHGYHPLHGSDRTS